ncbi:PsbP domain-containing protein 6 [Spatholobus suberectus]|nr:PsbP domain-containing protein 6 [Spatholobus suberectus]
MATFPFTSLLPLSVSSSSHSSSRLSTLHAFRASASESVPCQHTPRREFLKGIALQALPLVVLREATPSQAREVEVGAFLPPSPSDPSFVLFKASPRDTPALRAGNVKPYKFILPPTWKKTRVPNMLSGNYCQPKCDEPWVEVLFEDKKQGKIQVVASPLIRLTNIPNASIEDLGSPEKVIASLGQFVTGGAFDPDEVLETSVQKLGDQTYYTYVLETPYALTGTHNLAKATAKGNTVVLFVISANDEQWQTYEETLKAMLDSFEV